MIREDRNNVEKTITNMTTYTAEINLYNISVKRSEGVRAQRAPRRELCERQQLPNPVRFLCTLCTLIQTPEYDQRRPQQCREDRHKQKVLTLLTFSIYLHFDVRYIFNDCFALSTLLSVLCGFSKKKGAIHRSCSAALNPC